VFGIVMAFSVLIVAQNLASGWLVVERALATHDKSVLVSDPSPAETLWALTAEREARSRSNL